MNIQSPNRIEPPSNKTIVRPQPAQDNTGRRAGRLGYKLVGAAAGIAALGAVVLTAVAGDSTAPVRPSAPASTQPAPTVAYPAITETFPGCLNDIECNGEPSQLPPGYWDLPTMSHVD